jgi:hypothetical protein
MAYFYFDFRDNDKQTLHDLLPSLLIQLSARSDPCCDILSQLYLTHDRGVRKPSDRAMFERLKEMLSLKAQPPIYIILDAVNVDSDVDVPLPPPLSPAHATRDSLSKRATTWHAVGQYVQRKKEEERGLTNLSNIFSARRS